MNTNVIFIFVLLFSLQSMGQIDLKNNSLIHPEEKVLIRGLYNEIELTGIDTDSTFELITDHGESLQKSGDSYICTGSEDSTIVLSLIKDTQVFYSTTFRNLKYHDPKVYLGNLRDSMVTREELLQNLNLHLSFEPLPIKPCSTVRLREAKIIRKNGKVVDLNTKKYERWNNKMNGLSEEEWFEKAEKWERKFARNKRNQKEIIVNHSFDCTQEKLILKMNKGDVLWIQMCVISCPSCISRLNGPNLRFRLQ